ncbi:MAG: hypothetical protein WDZ85_01365 [Candidatus Paceibacterota bacterium]
MSLFDYLEKVRREPEAKRRRLLFIWTFAGTAVIVLLWLINSLVLMPRADDIDITRQREQFGQVKTTVKSAGERIYTGFDFIKDGVINLF